MNARSARLACLPRRLRTVSYLVPSAHKFGPLVKMAALAAVNGCFLLFPISIGVAMVRSRLYDIDVLTNRTLVYGALTISLVSVYFSLVVALQYVLRALTEKRQYSRPMFHCGYSSGRKVHRCGEVVEQTNRRLGRVVPLRAYACRYRLRRRAGRGEQLRFSGPDLSANRDVGRPGWRPLSPLASLEIPSAGSLSATRSALRSVSSGASTLSMGFSPILAPCLSLVRWPRRPTGRGFLVSCW